MAKVPQNTPGPIKAEAPAPSPEAKKDLPNKNNPVAVVEPKGTELANNYMEEFSGAGLENVTADQLLTPRLAILQSTSDQVKPQKPKYIDGAKIGEICDLATGELFEPPLHFLPVYFKIDWLEWAPLASGRGLLNVFTSSRISHKKVGGDVDPEEVLCVDGKIYAHVGKDQSGEEQFGKWTTEDGNSLVETAQFFGLNLSADGRRSFIPMANTQFKKAKSWLTTATSQKARKADGTMYTPPLFYRAYYLSSVPEGNKKGDWMGWVIKPGEKLEELGVDAANLAREAVAFYKSITRGEVKVDLSTAADEETIPADQRSM